jgi:hypothetical protein
LPPEPVVCQPPGYRHGYMAHFLKMRDGGTIAAVWMQFDKVWLIHGSFLSAREAAECGYTYDRPYSEEAP